MRKQLMTGVAAAAICLGLASCSRFDYTLISEGEQAYVNYENAFIEKFGEPAPDQTWGFGGSSTKATRSITNPAVAEASQPYTETWVTNYLATATEVNSTNATDNYDNGTNVSVQWNINSDGKLKYITDNYSNYTYDWFSFTKATKEEFEWYGKNIKPLFDNCGWNWNYNSDTSLAQKILDKLSEYNGDYNYWGITITRESGWVADPTFVRNFKITGTWDGSINVVATEGYTDGVKNGYERTVVVTGTWNLTAEQRVGSLGRIIVANGGKINLAAGSNLNSVNGAQIVVLPGGEITGEGTVAFNNGTSTELLSYNGGTIDVGKFNNNGGDFYNYGTLKAGTMDGGAGNSHYYNHGIVNIGQTGSSANLRLYNACQFYCSGNMRIRNYEGTQGSSLICAGELMLSGSEDGTSDASYVGLEAGALVQCGTLYNNGTSWSGPTEGGYAVLDITDKITFLNWEQDAPQNGGYFANNIYVSAGDWTNTPGGNGWSTWTAKEKFNVVRNAAGNGNVKYAQKTQNEKDELIPTSEDFQVGVKGCTPGFRGKPEPETIRIIAEDLSASEGSDFDFNDVVFDVKMNWPSEGKHTITLLAAGGTLPLTIAGVEVHAKFGVSTNKMVNTESWTEQRAPVTFVIEGKYANANEIEVRVQKGSDWPLLTAPIGKAASKIAVSTDYEWVKELQDITNAYGQFDTYVTTGKPAKWWESAKNDTYIYNVQ